ncbi:TIGR04282 family arsenosugar biosynthesis glycosyltransferase, partial [Chloroflexota bacterium]
ALSNLKRIFNDDKVQIGTFRLSFDIKHWFLKLLCFVACHNPITRFGDQCIVCRKPFLTSIGGFPDYLLFEDLSLIGKAKKLTKIYRFPMTVITSARRFQQNGFLRQQLRNICYILLYFSGVHPDKLAERYEAGKKTKGMAALIIMARFPCPGKVKTRLASTIGAKQAAEIYQLCAESVFEKVGNIEKARKYIFFADKEDKEKVEKWGGTGFNYLAQSRGDIGKRLQNAIGALFNRGASRVIALASDVPGITENIIEAAIRTLDNHDVVLGPSDDGGYYLIGMNRLHKVFFKNISWSTDKVLTQTLNTAKAQGLKVRCLQYLSDIDTEESLQRWSEAAFSSSSEKDLLKGARP